MDSSCSVIVFFSGLYVLEMLDLEMNKSTRTFEARLMKTGLEEAMLSKCNRLAQVDTRKALEENWNILVLNRRRKVYIYASVRAVFIVIVVNVLMMARSLPLSLSPHAGNHCCFLILPRR